MFINVNVLKNQKRFTDIGSMLIKTEDINNLQVFGSGSIFYYPLNYGDRKTEATSLIVSDSNTTILGASNFNYLSEKIELSTYIDNDPSKGIYQLIYNVKSIQWGIPIENNTLLYVISSSFKIEKYLVSSTIDEIISLIADYSPVTTDINLYIAGTTGDDTTGDGSIGSPFKTMLRAAQAVASKCSNIDITFFYTEAGTYVFGDAEKTELGLKQYSSCNIIFEGISSAIETGVSFTEASANKMMYNASKAGVTLAENDWRGYFINDSDIRYYPISYNSAGSDTFQVEYMRGARNGTRDVVDMPVILDMGGPTDDQFLEFDFIGLPNIKFWKLTLSRPGGIFDMSTLKAYIDFNFGLKWDCSTILTGQYSTHSVTNAIFVGNYFDLSISNFTAIDSRNASGNYSFTRCVIYSPNNSLINIIRFEKSSICELRETALIGGGGTSWGVSCGQNGAIVFSKTVIFRDMLAIVGSTNSPQQRIMNSNTEGYNYLLLFGLSYVISYADIGSEIDLYSIEADGSFVSFIYKTNVARYIDDLNGIRVSIGGTFPERGNIVGSVADSAVNYYIVVGSVAENESIRIEYTAKRGALIECGYLKLSNASDTVVGRVPELDDVGLAILKDINGDEIRLDITDTLTDGNATSLKLDIYRELT